jgi:hypothetical protein
MKVCPPLLNIHIPSVCSIAQHSPCPHFFPTLPQPLSPLPVKSCLPQPPPNITQTWHLHSTLFMPPSRTHTLSPLLIMLALPPKNNKTHRGQVPLLLHPAPPLQAWHSPCCHFPPSHTNCPLPLKRHPPVNTLHSALPSSTLLMLPLFPHPAHNLPPSTARLPCPS